MPITVVSVTTRPPSNPNLPPMSSFFFGRELESADVCSAARMLKDFNGSGHSLSELLVSVSRTDAFLYRAAPEVTP